MARRALLASILQYLIEHGQPAFASEIVAAVQAPRSTVNRALAALTLTGQIRKQGAGPGTQYEPATDVGSRVTSSESTRRTEAAQALRTSLSRPPGLRTPSTYERGFVDNYRPNESSLLPPDLAQTLYNRGRPQGQYPAGTVAMRVLEQLLIDLSWHSSHLEGNRKSLLDTRELFATGRGDPNDPDVTMLLNHKEAIEFMVEQAPLQGLTIAMVRNLHAILMQNLLQDPTAAGAIRRRVATIDSSVYQPTHVPALLEEMLRLTIDTAREIRNPIEASFFLWVNIAYLQPFEDGNKRTSRLSANLPLLMSNCAPLSFLDVEPEAYAYAMMGVYEERDVSLAVELFAATYVRSIDKYRVALQSFGVGTPLRARYRVQLADAVRRVVAGEQLAGVTESLHIQPEDQQEFSNTVRAELVHLEAWNCARFRLSIPEVEQWIAAGRPGAT
jgi:fido (protein-threonine AMPylation protein)